MWIYLPSTLYQSAQESAVSTLDLNSQQTERLAQSVSLNAKLSRPQSWRLAWKRKRWIRVLSGATLEHSTASRGVESWIASLADIRVSHSQAQESDLVKMIRDTYGLRSVESLRRSNLASCSSRMSQVISHSDSPTFSEIYKKWVSDVRLDCLRRRKSARRIDANDSLFSAWPTVTAQAEARVLTGAPRGSRKNPTIMDAVENWPTPRAACPGSRKEGTGGKVLEEQAQNWPTPMAEDSQDAGSPNGMKTLARETKNFQISHQDQETSTYGEEFSSHILNWPQRSQNWQTPAACDGEGGTLEIREEAAGKYKLGDQVGSRKRLNPIFTEWMMGWPRGWTDFEPVGMALSLWWPRMRSRLFSLVSENKA